LARTSVVQPGRLAQGPDEKLGFSGRVSGIAMIVSLHELNALLNARKLISGGAQPVNGHLLRCGIMRHQTIGN
jgi:hypothetical protein